MGLCASHAMGTLLQDTRMACMGGGQRRLLLAWHLRSSNNERELFISMRQPITALLMVPSQAGKEPRAKQSDHAKGILLAETRSKSICGRKAGMHSHATKVRGSWFTAGERQ